MDMSGQILSAKGDLAAFYENPFYTQKRGAASAAGQQASKPRAAALCSVTTLCLHLSRSLVAA